MAYVQHRMPCCRAIWEQKHNKLNLLKEEESIPNNVIKYTAALKLEEIAEATFDSSGLAYKYIDANIVNHTFENGIGIIEFDKDVTEFTSGSYSGWGFPSAFKNCAITSIIIPNSVTSMGNGTFYNCSGLTSVTIPNSVTSIGDDAFNGCTSLTSIKIPASVTSIGNFAFSNCSGLTSVTIGNSVTSIGHSAFRECSGLTSVTVEAITPPTLGNNAIPNDVTNIYVHAESVDTYKAANGWSTYAAKIQAIP